MVRVIPIYLSAELLCPNLFWEGGGINGSRGRRAAEREPVASVMWSRRARSARGEVYLIAVQFEEQQQRGGGFMRRSLTGAVSVVKQTN